MRTKHAEMVDLEEVVANQRSVIVYAQQEQMIKDQADLDRAHPESRLRFTLAGVNEEAGEIALLPVV